ncbi:MAG: tetratricopeptide repeat protein [Paludibacteraceae bacterium]|nr:tetratricopeptide repeat protein [Paludibacteraceae bacterium]
MKRIFLSIVLMGAFVVGLAQSAANADLLFTNGDYSAAKDIYEQLTRRYPTNTLYLYRYARCAQEMGDHHTAIEYFLRAGDRYPLKYFFLGESYMQLWYNQEAIDSYEKYLEITTGEDKKEHINDQIVLAQKRLRYLRRVENISVIGYEELPVKNLLNAYKLSNNAGTLSQDETGAITYTAQRGDRCIFAMKSDSTSVLCNRFRLLDQWEKADTLPQEVNLSTQQNYPYCLNDGMTVYFASNDSTGFGGLDIYITRYNTATEKFTTPENLGFPFNSTGNDYMYAVDEEKGIGYFATDRFSSNDSVRVYTFLIKEPKNYLHDLSTDTLALYAQLKLYDQADSIKIRTEEVVDTITTQTAIFFVLNDSTIYTSLNDFHSKEARKLYDDYILQNSRLEAICTQLDTLRKQYAEVSEENKNNLTQTILTLEKGKIRLVQSLQQTLLNVRQLEMNNH